MYPPAATPPRLVRTLLVFTVTWASTDVLVAREAAVRIVRRRRIMERLRRRMSCCCSQTSSSIAR
jgi:hypothetical protein